jgi:hypothetical protein
VPSVQNFLPSVHALKSVYVHTCSIKWTKTFQDQGCQTIYFQSKNTNLGKFWSALEGKMLEYFTAILHILRPFVNVVIIWCVFPPFCHEESGNPVQDKNDFRLPKTETIIPFSENTAGFPPKIEIYKYCRTVKNHFWTKHFGHKKITL